MKKIALIMGCVLLSACKHTTPQTYNTQAEFMQSDAPRLIPLLRYASDHNKQVCGAMSFVQCAAIKKGQLALFPLDYKTDNLSEEQRQKAQLEVLLKLKQSEQNGYVRINQGKYEAPDWAWIAVTGLIGTPLEGLMKTVFPSGVYY